MVRNYLIIPGHAAARLLHHLEAVDSIVDSALAFAHRPERFSLDPADLAERTEIRDQLTVAHTYLQEVNELLRAGVQAPLLRDQDTPVMATEAAVRALLRETLHEFQPPASVDTAQDLDSLEEAAQLAARCSQLAAIEDGQVSPSHPGGARGTAGNLDVAPALQQATGATLSDEEFDSGEEKPTQSGLTRARRGPARVAANSASSHASGSEDARLRD